MAAFENTDRCVICGGEIPEGRRVCAECEDKADKLLRHRAEEVADELDYCRKNVTCLKCRRLKRNMENAECCDELMRDAANLLRALAHEPEGEEK